MSGLYLQSNLHVRPPLVSDRPPPMNTTNPKHQNFPCQSLTGGTSSKRPPPVSDCDQFLGLTVNDFSLLLTSCKWPPPVSDHSVFSFWVVPYGRFVWSWPFIKVTEMETPYLLWTPHDYYTNYTPGRSKGWRLVLLVYSHFTPIIRDK